MSEDSYARFLSADNELRPSRAAFVSNQVGDSGLTKTVLATRRAADVERINKDLSRIAARRKRAAAKRAR